MSHKTADTHRLRSVCALALLLCFANVHAQTQPPSPCDNVVAEAQKLYDEGRFTLAAKRLDPCVEKLPKEQRIGAYRLLALAYLAEDRVEEAKEAIKDIFKLKRDYVCDRTSDPKPYCDLVVEVEPTIPKPLSQKLFGGWKKAPWITVVAIAGYGVGKAILGSPDEKPLPEPPGLPSEK